MGYYSKEEIQEARQMDLLTYLANFEPDELVKVNRTTYCTKTHDSLKISNGMWFWFSRGIGGKSAVDYLVKVCDYRFTDAIEKILGYSNENLKIFQYEEKHVENVELVLPRKNFNTCKVTHYLKSRAIDEEVISECISRELIYEDIYSNAVFVGYDENNIPKYASVRGTNSTRYMKEVYGSNKAYSFKLKANKANKTLHLFESAIDLLSYVTILKQFKVNWHEHNFLSLGGVFQPSKDAVTKIPIALSNFLESDKNITRLVLHLDNDNAGRLAAKSIKINLESSYEVVDSPPSIGKDVNDFLMLTSNNRTKERGIENER